ncbi:MAG TPA: ATP-binding protein [Tepidisphaeraceae bacterium]|nr:ATP-binding protein [Tepidisphaeraceae bacterium]
MGIAGSNRHPDRAARRKTAGGAKAAAPAATSRNGSPGGRANGTAAAAKLPLQFTIPSVLSATRDVHKTIMDAVERHHYGEQSQFAIRLSLEEGLMNAVKHGNKLDPRKTVRIEATVTARSTEIFIEDQGKGFDRKRVPDPCASENLLKCSGRGILLMETYMDKVEYSNGGRRVRMVKKNA